MYKGSCTKKEAEFLLSKLFVFDIPHFYINWKILKNPIVGRPIVAGYNWILTPASIFVGHYLKELYSKFENILTDSISLIKILEISKFDKDCFFIHNRLFKFVHQYFSMEALEFMKRLFFRYQNMTPNAQFILELLEIILMEHA